MITKRSNKKNWKVYGSRKGEEYLLATVYSEGNAVMLAKLMADTGYEFVRVQ